jgi:chromosome segregation ATPase
MSWFGFGKKGDKAKKSQKSQGKKKRYPRKTFILEEIVTPSLMFPVLGHDFNPLQHLLDSLPDLHSLGLMADGGACPVSPPTNGDLAPIIEVDPLGLMDAPTPIPATDFQGLFETLPKGVIFPIDPPGNTPKVSALDPSQFGDIDTGFNAHNPDAFQVTPVTDITLTPETRDRALNLSSIFTSVGGQKLSYVVLGGNSDSLAVTVEGNQLQLKALDKPGTSNVIVKAIDEKGNFVTTNVTVTTSNVNPATITSLDNALGQLTSILNQYPDLGEGLSTPEAGEYLDTLANLLEQNPELLPQLTKPEFFASLGLNNSNIATIQQLLQSPEIADEMGLSVSLGEALSNPDSTSFDQFLINAQDAIYLLPENAQQPKVGFIDFAEKQHAEKVTSLFSSVNSLAKYDTFTVSNGNWHEQLIKFVEQVRVSGENRGVVNLSLDLSQLDDIGKTTRYELTPQEQIALQYARDNNVLLVVAAGNTGGLMSALGEASKTFDNIITVGAVNQFEGKTDYSAYGDGLTVMAPGGSWQDDPNAFVGTSRATSYVTAAASLVWAGNPDLSWQQVKELLIETSRDINQEGWDKETGFGIIDIKEAIARSLITEPKTVETQAPVTVVPFSGEGRVKTLARAAGDNTEKAISALNNTQQNLFEQWQTLADLGNPDISLADLDAEVKQKIAAALNEYQQVSTDAGITTAQAQQWAEALVLATQHYQIEATRLQTLLQQQKEVKDQLAALGQQKSALETETKKMLADIQDQIDKAESDLAAAKAKLTNPFADVDKNLKINPQPWQNAANNEQQSASNFSQQANVQNAAAQNYNSTANSINPTRWQVVGSTSRPCGRTQEIWGWGNDPNLLKQKTQLQLQGQISSQNVQAFQQLAQQADQQNAALTQYAQFLSEQQNLNLGNGNTNDANTVLQLLQKQLSDQENIANNYQKLMSLAEARRVQNQNSADWNNSQINRWQQVGTRRTGPSGRNTEPVYGWVHYPEYIAPRNQAQRLANQAVQERDVYKQLASQSHEQVTVLREQVRKLSERVKDWPVLQQGIEYEIDADALRLQAEKDLLALHTPVQEQKLETLNLQISQAEEQLKTLENQKLPTQQQATDLTENRLKETQTEVEAIQTKRAEAQKDLQNFLETAGFLLPYRERLAAVQKTVEQLETEKLNVQSVMQQLDNLMLQTPSDSLRQQVNYWNDHLATLNQELAWAKLQQDQLALAIADSPERLAISGLIKELEGATTGGATTGGLPLQRYLDFLHNVEGSGANFLEGFDNLPQRLADAKAEDTQTQKDLDKLNQEYRELGLQKANLQDNLIPGKEKEIVAKEQQIAGTESAIAQTQTSLNNQQNQLTQTQDSLAQKSAEIKQQEAVIASNQSQLTNTQNQIASNQSQIQQQQSVAQGNQNQINQANAAVNSLEQQRQANQNAANYWNSQIGVFNEAAYLAYNRDVAYHVSMGWLQSGWQHYVTWGWREGRLPNPQAVAYRNNYQSIANSRAQQRDAAQVNAVQLTATLQPQIAVTQQQIATLQNQQQSLTQEQQALNSQLANQQTQLQQLQKEQQAITQQANNLQSQIDKTQKQLNDLNTQLGNQQQQREDLIAQLAQLNQEKSDIEQKLIEKYREIELTDKYFEQVEAEVNRLQSRVDLLDQAGIIEKQYQNNWDELKQAVNDQNTATENLLDTRQAGQSDRDLLASLETQLSNAKTNLETAKKTEADVNNTKRDLEITELQIDNQDLLLQSLNARDPGLAEREAFYYNEAQKVLSKMWVWNGKAYAYNQSAAASYRANLQQSSFYADQRNRTWKELEAANKRITELNQQLAKQNADISTFQQELVQKGTPAQITTKINELEQKIKTVNDRLKPLIEEETQQKKNLGTASEKVTSLTSELVPKTEMQGDALRQLIGFGMLASESDVDFFATQVKPQVSNFIDKLQNRSSDLNDQINTAKATQSKFEELLANTTDNVSKETLIKAIVQSQIQITQLEQLKTQDTTQANDLQKLLAQALDALTPLRQKQELEIRKKLESNDGRLESLQSQLNSENAADAAIKSGTVLDHVLLANQINQDLRLGATNWTEQFLAGNQQTTELVTQQQDLSNSVDELIAYINNNLAEPDGNYNRIQTDLANGITTLGVVENRADELDTAFTSTDDAIERIKLRIAQDAALWEEIAPIAIRYGVESQQLADFTKLAQKLQELLAKSSDLAAKQAASEAKAAEVREDWEDATNYDDAPINQINFGNKLVESRRGQDNLVYVRNSTDGGKTWTKWLHTGGGTNFDSIKTAVVDNKLFQSVRGTDGQVWLRSSSDGVKWAKWSPIGGSINGDYSMDVVGKNLVFSLRNTNNQIYSRTAVNGTQWQNWASLGTTMSDIVQDVVDGKAIQSYRGFDNQIYVRQSADDIKWETWEKIDAAIAKADGRQEYLQNLQNSDTHNLNAVTRTHYKDKLVEAVRGKDNLMYSRASTDGGKTWSNWQYSKVKINSDVQMVVANNALVQAVRGTDNILYVRQSNDGINWNNWAAIRGAISDDFSIDAIDNKVVFSVQGNEKKLYSRTLIPNVSWTNWEASPLTTINSIEQKLIDGKIVQSYKGVDDRTYVRYSTDGLNWKNWETLENAVAKAEINQQYLGELQENRDQNPNPVTRTQYKDKLVEAVRGKDNLIYGRYSTDGGKTWSNWQNTGGKTKENIKTVVANNTLFQVVKDVNNGIDIRQSSDGVNWTAWKLIGGNVADDFLVDVIDNKVVFSIHNGDNKFYSRTLIPNVRWTDWQASPVNTLDGISQKVVDGKVVQTYQGVDGQIYTRSTADGLTWSAWENHDAITKQYQQEKEALLPLISKETSLAAGPFLEQNKENGTAIDLLQAATLEGKNSSQQISQQLNATQADVLLKAESVEGSNPLQVLFDKSKAAQASHEAQGYALLAQATWYQQQAAYHWAHSRKNGPYWYEQRWVDEKCGKGHWETVTHVDQNWIIWQKYSQIFPQLRAQGEAQLVEADKWRKEKERIEPLKNQWIAANNAANDAEPPIDEARNFFAELEAARESIPGDQVQLASLENLLPTLKEQLEQAESVAAAQNAKVQQQWAEYDTNSEEYRAAIADILQRRGELNRKAIETQQQLADAEGTVERQTVALSDEVESTKSLSASLENQRQAIENQIITLQNQGVTGEELDNLNTNLVQVNQSLKWLNNKAAVLTAEQTALTQKRTMLTAQNEVILAEQRLLDAYINDPDADYSNLQQQLDNARAALAEAQRLAEQAEAASQALTASLQQLKTDLLAQNDKHLKAAKEHQTILKALVEATQSNANYTLQAAQKQQEVNDLELEILQRLQQAADAGYKEAKALLDVAQHNDMATAAEIYYRDYSDLASDKGGGCSPGLARPEDRMLADQYYQQMLQQRELQRRAQAQADEFRVTKETAEAQMKTLQSQQETAAQLLNDLNAKVAETQEERENKTQELAIAQARLDGITRIREQTEQTFIQLVTLEKLNLAQAQLEQEIAQNRQADIDQAVQDRLERDALELERKRLETTAKIEQLKQLQAEDDLRQSLNNVRAQVGLDTLDPTTDPMQVQTQLAGLLTSLKDLETQQPDLPDNVKALLAEARGDINLALQGKEAANIQESLLSAMDGMIGQIESYKSEINKIDLDEQLDNELLQTAQTDLQGASQQFLKELKLAEALSGEKQIINPLYEEVLNKIALAEQAVEISSDLAKQGKQMLDQIIKQRIAERKARKKAFWNKILSIVSTVFSLLGTVLTFIPGANLVGLALAAIGGVISVIQSAINGDWMGAIFSAIMTGASFVGGAIGNALKAGQAMIMGMGKAVAQKVLSTIKAFQSLASGAFNGVRNILSGDKIMGFLQIMGGLAGAATSGISGFVQGGLSGLSDIGKFGYKVLESLSKAPTLIYGGIKAIQSGDWVSGIGNMIKGVISLGKTWTNDFNDGSESPGEKIANILENISSVGIGVSKFITGGLEGLLEGLGDILDGLGDDIQKWVENLVAGGNCECVCPCSEEDEEDIEEVAQEIFDEVLEEVDDSDLTFEEKGKALVEGLAERLQDENIAPELKAQVINNLETTEEQAEVIRSLPSSQQQEVFHNLPEATQKEWAKTYFQDQYNQDQQSTNSSTDITTPVSGNVDPITGAVVLTGNAHKGTNPILDFVWGALQGEFNQNPSFGQVIFNVLISLTPLGVVTDSVDVVYYVNKFKNNPDEMKDPGNWVGAFASLIGFLPVGGDLIEGAIKGAIKELQLLALGKVIKKFDNVLQLSRMPSEQVNVIFINRGHFPPYAKNTLVSDIIFKSDPKDLVRVHLENNQVGPWLMRRQDIEGLTPAQIKDKFALPSMPKYVSDVRGLENMAARVGVAGPINGFGSGGGVQIELLERVNEGNFINKRELP